MTALVSRRTVLALVVAVPWVLWAATRTFGLERSHPFVAAMAFTPYVAATAWIPLVLSLALRSRAAALVSVAALAALVLAVAPRAFGGPQPAVAGGRPLTVMTANLFFGRGDARAVMDLARRNGVDVLSLQESTPDSIRRLDAAGARSLFPYRVMDAREGTLGTALLAAHPLVDQHVPPWPHIPMPQGTLEAPGLPAIQITDVHPPPPLHSDVEVWQDGLRSFPHATTGGMLRILAGDFNATLDHDALRELIDSGYTDAADAVGAGLRGTYHGSRITPPIAIDHVLVDRRVQVTAVSVHRIPGSDHNALLVRLTVPAQTANR
jgi:endonuclease/exonuclease/phosphatase (EEP) superfamily protein YafD